MNDEEYVYRRDVAEKKKAARGSYHKVRGGGKHVRMPSDYLTGKERKSLNGEVKTYSMNKPMEWDEFKKMPDDLQIAYIRGLVVRFRAPRLWIREMFGVSEATMKVWATQHSFVFQSQPGRALVKNRPAWDAFINGEELEKEPEPDTPPTTPHTPVSISEGKDIGTENIARILAMLCGTGAKLTIEVTL